MIARLIQLTYFPYSELGVLLGVIKLLDLVPIYLSSHHRRSVLLKPLRASFSASLATGSCIKLYWPQGA